MKAGEAHASPPQGVHIAIAGALINIVLGCAALPAAAPMLGAIAVPVVSPNPPAEAVTASTPVAIIQTIPALTYTVKRGDTLGAIASQFGVDFRDLATWNRIANPNLIFAGQVLTLSPPGQKPQGPQSKDAVIVPVKTAEGATTLPQAGKVAREAAPRAVLPATAVEPQVGTLVGLVGEAPALAVGGGGDANTFLRQAFLLEVTVTKANLAIVAAYAAEEDRAKYQAQFQALGNPTDPKEAGAKVQEIRVSAESDLKRLSAQADLANRTATLSEEKQRQVATGVGNILWAGVQVVPLIANGKLIVARIKSNPLELLNMLPVASAVQKLVSTGILAGSVMGNFVEVLKGVNVAVPDAKSIFSAANIEQI